MDKIIAKELPPEEIDFSFYFENDTFLGKDSAIYIPQSRYIRGLNTEAYDEIVSQAESIIEGFHDIGKHYFETFKDVMEYNSVSFTKETYSLLRKWAKNADTNNNHDIARYLSIVTGKSWNVRTFRGYVQGSYCQVVYCTDCHSEEFINEAGNFWLCCGTEFCIDGVSGYYVLDTIRWEENEKLVNLLAEYACCKPADLNVYLYKGSHTVADYRLLKI